ncbi:Nucleoporin seh1 [Orchesella cincta]|uniref:Nucleoporin seh1 n=1 Tax=Orchesella cincta TaxID=48709 RepID=A0A1D2MBY2_ORCCI|nr:Nucleoporin seh1 [Orchesella cincta]
MFVARGLETGHKDLIHDIAFDFYGTRMATCSSDQMVRIWELKGEGSSVAHWNCTASWKAHSGSVWKVTWAHPEFGQVVATSSFDRSAAVWQERVEKDKFGGGAGVVGTHWVKKATLVDSRQVIYEAPDIIHLSQWSLQYEISVKMPLSCVSWNPTYPPVCSDYCRSDDSNADAPKVLLYEFNERNRQWNRKESLKDITDPVNDLSFAPNLGRSYHLLGVATRNLKIVGLQPFEDIDEVEKTFRIRTVAECEEHNSSVWRVAWNVTGTILASSGMMDAFDFGKGTTWETGVVLLPFLVYSFPCQTPDEWLSGNISVQHHSDVSPSKVELSPKWPNGVIKYKLNDTLTSTDKTEVSKAFEEFHRKTCIKFQPWEEGNIDFLSQK